MIIGPLVSDPSITVIRSRPRTSMVDDLAGVEAFIRRVGDLRLLQFDVCDPEGRVIAVCYGSPYRGCFSAGYETQRHVPIEPARYHPVPAALQTNGQKEAAS